MDICEKFLIVLISVCFYYLGFANLHICGEDRSNNSDIKEGEATIETYPWLGLLFYPVGIQDDLVTTTIVLITKRMALAPALEIDKYPKSNFRDLARVVLGHNCSGPYIKVRDYTYHPDFIKSTYSTLAMVQLDTMMVSRVIHPICASPVKLRSPQVYAMTLTEDCTSSMVRIYKMEYVDSSECQEFYRRSNLDVESLWPTHYACARATYGGHCVWKSGTVLVTRDEKKKWRLLGIGVFGPGCESPSRFLDYGMYTGWVRQSIARVGRPAITRIAPNHLILRRTADKLQRFGTCDLEEMKEEIYTDYTEIRPYPPQYSLKSKVFYNLTLISNIDYSCVILQVLEKYAYAKLPTLRLRRYCTNPHPVCYDSSILEIHFAVEITFYGEVGYRVSAYGTEMKLIDVKEYRLYANKLFYGEGIPIKNIPRSTEPSMYEFITASPVPSLELLQDPQQAGLQHVIHKTV